MSHIQTYSGRMVDPFEMTADDVRIRDIAHALSNLCRFTGHVRHFYSVAEHSVHASRAVYGPDINKMKALLHDAPEAYFNDLARPVKHRPEMQFYRDAEDRLCRIIFMKYTETGDFPDAVKEADEAMLHREALSLMHMGSDWADPNKASDIRPVLWTPYQAEQAFLNRYAELRFNHDVSD